MIKKCKKVGLAHMVQHHSSNEAFLESQNRMADCSLMKRLRLSPWHRNATYSMVVKSSNHLLLKYPSQGKVRCPLAKALLTALFQSLSERRSGFVGNFIKKEGYGKESGHQNVRQASVLWLMSRSGAMWQRSVPTPISPSL